MLPMSLCTLLCRCIPDRCVLRSPRGSRREPLRLPLLFLLPLFLLPAGGAIEAEGARRRFFRAAQLTRRVWGVASHPGGLC